MVLLYSWYVSVPSTLKGRLSIRHSSSVELLFQDPSVPELEITVPRFDERSEHPSSSGEVLRLAPVAGAHVRPVRKLCAATFLGVKGLSAAKVPRGNTVGVIGIC